MQNLNGTNRKWLQNDLFMIFNDDDDGVVEMNIQ